MVQQTIDPSFSTTGWWYSYFEGDSLEVSDLNEAIPLEPGQFQIFTTKKLSAPEITARLPEFETASAPFRVYPNPFNDWLQIEAVPEKSRLRIIHSNGQVVQKIELHEYQNRVDLSSLSPGFYLLIRQIGNGASEYVKVIRE